jgi:predicted permease
MMILLLLHLIALVDVVSSTANGITTTTDSTADKLNNITALLDELKHELVTEIDPRVALVAFKATIKLIVALALGVWAARQKNVLDVSAVQSLSRLTYYIFQPALVFCSVSKTLHAGSSGLPTSALSVMPFAAIIQIGLGYASSMAITWILPLQNSQDERDVIVCSSFANSAPLPLLFTSSLFNDSYILQADVTACISFYLMVWSPIFYTAGPHLLRTKEERETGFDLEADATKHNKEDIKDVSSTLDLHSLVSPPVIASFLGLAVGLIPVLSNLFLTDNGLAVPVHNAVNTFSKAYLPSTILILAGSMVGSSSSSHKTQQTKDKSRRIIMPTRTNSLEHPLDRSTAGPAVSRKRTRQLPLSLDGASTSRADASVSTMSVCCWPSAPLVLDNTAPHHQRRGVSIRTIFLIMISRFVVIPIITLLLLKVASSVHLLPGEGTRSHAVLTFTILMESFMPAAQNTVVLLQLQGKKEQATRLTKLLTVLYVVAMIPITVWLSHTMALTGIMKCAVEATA